MANQVNIDILHYPEGHNIQALELGSVPFILLETNVDETVISQDPDTDSHLALHLASGGGLALSDVRAMLQLAIDAIDTSGNPALMPQEFI